MTTQFFVRQSNQSIHQSVYTATSTLTAYEKAICTDHCYLGRSAGDCIVTSFLNYSLVLAGAQSLVRFHFSYSMKLPKFDPIQLFGTVLAVLSILVIGALLLWLIS